MTTGKATPRCVRCGHYHMGRCAYGERDRCQFWKCDTGKFRERSVQENQ